MLHCMLSPVNLQMSAFGYMTLGREGCYVSNKNIAHGQLNYGRANEAGWIKQ